MSVKVSGVGGIKMSSTPPVTVDLPASGGTPAEIDLTGEMTTQVSLNVEDDFYWTTAENATDGASNLGSDATRGKLPSGQHIFYCSANYSYKLYIKSQSASATTSGLSYVMEEPD